MMRVILVLITIVLSSNLFALNLTKKPKNTLLWKITSPDKKTISYIYGTIHVIEKELFKFPSKLQKLIIASDTIVLELAGAGNQQEIQKHIFLKNETLQDFFNEDQQDSINVWVKSNLGLNKDDFWDYMGMYKPFIIAETILLHSFLDRNVSYEKEIDQIVRKIKNKNTAGLETVEEQMSLFDSLSRYEQAKLVLDAIKNEASNKNVLNKLQKAYVDQNLDELFELISSDSSYSPIPYKKLISERNEKWISELNNLFSNYKSFVAVGAGHLPGEDGLINLLRKKGYNVKPIYLK